MPGRLLPAPSRRRCLACCTPQRVQFPSGSAWAHSRFCTDRGARRQKLTLAELALLRGEELPARSLTPTEANRLRPAGELALRCWLDHAAGCTCYGCAYTDAHADDGGTDGSDVATTGT